MEHDEAAIGHGRAAQPTHAAPVAAPWLYRALRATGSSREARFFVLVVAAGICGGLGAIVLRSAMGWLQGWIFDAASDVLHAGREAGVLRRLFAPTLGCAAAGVVLWLTAHVRGGGGVATLMEAVSIRGGVVSALATIYRSIASVLAMAGGASVGREGPIIALSSAAASWLGQHGWLEQSRLRLLVACGAAAGFAAAYNTPVAGVLFVLEVIIGVFSAELLGPIALASVIGAVLARWSFFGGHPLYEVPVFELRSVFELPIYVVLGLVTAAGGALFLEALRGAERLFARVGTRPVRTALGGLIVGTIAALGLPEVYGNGYEATSEVLGGVIRPELLWLIFGAKILATSATVGSGVPGGVFTPTLLLGACLGGALGHGVHTLFPSVAQPGAYALVGMGAMLSATTHAPVLAVVFIFEVSQDYAILLPLLLSCSVATLWARRLRPRSIYAEELERRGIRWDITPEARVLEALRVRDVMHTRAATIDANAPVFEVFRVWLHHGAQPLFVLDRDERLLGVIDAAALSPWVEALCERLAAAEPAFPGAAQPRARTLARSIQPLRPEQTLLHASERLWQEQLEALPVVDPKANGRFRGALSRRHLLATLDSELLRRNVMLAKVRWRSDAGEVTDFFELPPGMRLEQLPLPRALVGKSLADAELGHERRLNVLAVIRHTPEGRTERFSPHADDPLIDGDVLVVLGSAEAIEALREP